MFHHLENIGGLDDLKKENERVLEMISNIDSKIKELEDQIVKKEELIFKLDALEKRLEKFSEVEKNI